MEEEEPRLPTGLWVDAVLQPLNARGIFYYITNKGNHASGVLMLKLNSLGKGCRLLIQQRNIEGHIEWIDALDEETLEEQKADAYIQRAIARDPDLWVIEIEDQDMNNPFAETF